MAMTTCTRRKRSRRRSCPSAPQAGLDGTLRIYAGAAAIGILSLAAPPTQGLAGPAALIAPPARFNAHHGLRTSRGSRHASPLPSPSGRMSLRRPRILAGMHGNHLDDGNTAPSDRNATNVVTTAADIEEGLHGFGSPSQPDHESDFGSYSLTGFSHRKHPSSKSDDATKLHRPSHKNEAAKLNGEGKIFQPPLDKKALEMAELPVSKASYSRLVATDAPYFNTSLPEKTKTKGWIGAWEKWREPIELLGHLGEGTMTGKHSRAEPPGKSIRNGKTSTMGMATKQTRRKSQEEEEDREETKLGLPIGMDPETPLKLSDLEAILRANGYLRKSDLRSSREREDPSVKVGGDLGASTAKLKTKGGVAFPQPSVLSYRAVKVGTTLTSGLLGFILASSVTRSLWLVGMTFGGIYGQSVSKNLNDPDLSPVGEFVIKCGRKLAQSYLNAYDFIQGMWFMYRTGQLSYDYWKQYAALDERFRIQDKIDAWNARFVEGKKNFDKWERENEVGRKVLAGLRTIWMVEETSYRKQLKNKRAGGESKYRLVRFAKNIIAWFQRLAIALWQMVTGEGKGELSEFLRGIRVQLSELSLEVVAQRAGSAVTLLTLTSSIGALFATAPGVLSFLAIAAGIIWPDWVAEAYFRMRNIVDETRARGRGEAAANTSSSQSLTPTTMQKQSGNKVRFHYFVRKDGSKRWYRTGTPLFRKLEEKDEEGGGIRGFLSSIAPFRKEDEKGEEKKGFLFPITPFWKEEKGGKDEEKGFRPSFLRFKNTEQKK